MTEQEANDIIYGTPLGSVASQHRVPENETFKSRPTEKDTAILDVVYAELDDVPVMIETWCWDGITGRSCIVPLDSLSKAKIDTEVFTEDLIKVLTIKGSTISKQSEGFLFLNFGFET